MIEAITYLNKCIASVVHWLNFIPLQKFLSFRCIAEKTEEVVVRTQSQQQFGFWFWLSGNCKGSQIVLEACWEKQHTNTSRRLDCFLFADHTLTCYVFSLKEVEIRNKDLEGQLSDLEQRLEKSQNEQEAFRNNLKTLLEILDGKIFELTELRDNLAKLIECS